MVRHRRLLQVAAYASAALFALSVFAWIEAVRLPDYANYWEWNHGWHIAVRNAGTLDHPIWWDTYASIGQFPDRGVRPMPSGDALVSPYRWPDLEQKECRLVWPLAASFVAPFIWIMRRLRRVENARGFPIERSSSSRESLADA